MSPGRVWWERIGACLRFVDSVTDCLREERSAVLRIPERFPWRETFYEQVDMRRERFSGDRRLKRMDWRGGEPGAVVLRDLCPARVQTEYWPGITEAEYLASRPDLELCDFYVWVRGVHTRDGLAQWERFVTEYEKAAQAARRAVFLLEYDGSPVQNALLPVTEYAAEEYDCQVFCLELASAPAGNAHRGYRAELALRIGNGDPELCAALLDLGAGLPEDPVAAAQAVLREARNAAGQPFPAQSESETASAVWRAAVVLLFPILERFRFDFITRYQTELARFLPITNSNGDQVTEPFDLELGSLFYVVHNAGYAFSGEDAEQVSLCRNVRNLLAHNKPVPYEDVQTVLAFR